MADLEATRDAGPLVREDGAVQDLFQETYLRAFRALPRFRGEAGLTTWMLTIARNLAFSRWRRRRTEAAWVDVMEAPPDRADPRADEKRLPDLAALLGALPAVQREAVLLYYVEDFPVEEVARLTGRPLNTVKSDLRRARMALRAHLASGEE